MDPSKNTHFPFDPKQFQTFVAAPSNKNPQTNINPTTSTSQGVARQSPPLVLESNKNQYSNAAVASNITTDEEEILKLLPELNDDQLSNALKYNFIRWGTNGWQLTHPALEKIGNGSLSLQDFRSKIGLPQTNNTKGASNIFQFFGRTFTEEKNLCVAADNGYLTLKGGKWEMTSKKLQELNDGDKLTLIEVYSDLLGLDADDPKRNEAYSAARRGALNEVIIKILERTEKIPFQSKWQSAP